MAPPEQPGRTSNANTIRQNADNSPAATLKGKCGILFIRLSLEQNPETRYPPEKSGHSPVVSTPCLSIRKSAFSNAKDAIIAPVRGFPTLTAPFTLEGNPPARRNPETPGSRIFTGSSGISPDLCNPPEFTRNRTSRRKNYICRLKNQPGWRVYRSFSQARKLYSACSPEAVNPGGKEGRP